MKISKLTCILAIDVVAWGTRPDDCGNGSVPVVVTTVSGFVRTQARTNELREVLDIISDRDRYQTHHRSTTLASNHSS